MQKHLYDTTVEYDSSRLPKRLTDLIDELLEFDKKGDWLSYDLKFDVLDVVAKDLYRRGIIKEYDYKMILRKYGWIYD